MVVIRCGAAVGDAVTAGNTAALGVPVDGAPEGRIATSNPVYLVLTSSAHVLGVGADARIAEVIDECEDVPRSRAHDAQAVRDDSRSGVALRGGEVGHHGHVG